MKESDMRVNTPTNHAAATKELKKAVSIYAHAVGMVVRTIPQTVMKKMGKRFSSDHDSWAAAEAAEGTEAAKRHMRTAKEMYEGALKAIIEKGMCQNSVDSDFAKKILQGTYRTDENVLVAFRSQMATLKKAGSAIRPCAVLAWAPSDRVDIVDDFGKEDETEVEIVLGPKSGGHVANEWLAANDVAEIDLVCAAKADSKEAHAGHKFWHASGSGRTLLSYTLGEIAGRKRGGQRRFDAVITYTAHEEGRAPPIVPSLTALGFKKIDVWYRKKGTTSMKKSTRDYYILMDDVAAGGDSWAAKIANAIDVGPCPTVPGKGPVCR